MSLELLTLIVSGVTFLIAVLIAAKAYRIKQECIDFIEKMKKKNERTSQNM